MEGQPTSCDRLLPLEMAVLEVLVQVHGRRLRLEGAAVARYLRVEREVLGPVITDMRQRGYLTYRDDLGPDWRDLALTGPGREAWVEEGLLSTFEERARAGTLLQGLAMPTQYR